ncbi:MAG: GTP-binding protein [Ruminococcaceae bacterium]|nr:GTP-binding protein [Oscillospiraceae bacterium]
MSGQPKKKHICVGLLAHVDAGKTTLAEALLYSAGSSRSIGRVDKGDTVMDTHRLERERGITIFASQAEMTVGDLDITLLDTPGHVDFSSETERTLQVLDYAVLVISGIDGVQAHTRTLWRLLEGCGVPVIIFVSKMDLAEERDSDNPQSKLMAELQKELNAGCINFSADRAERDEALAMCSEPLLERFLEGGEITDSDAAALILSRRAFPCFFGSGLKLKGIDELMEGLQRFIIPPEYPQTFGGRVFKISRDKNERLTHIKVSGGVLKVKDTVTIDGVSEKINQIRIYSGAKYVTVDELPAGSVCAVTGLTHTAGGMGLGYESHGEKPVLEPVMNYRITLPEGCDARTLLPKLRTLEEEDPQLHITWKEFLQEIHVSLMGEVQTEILKSLISEKFGVDVGIDQGRVLYKETIENTVEGVGHYEPLRHYAEVHLLMEPLPRGSGLVFDTMVSEDDLDRNWQRLVLMHLNEKQHIGVLTGSPITDMRITLTAGRAHLKHTEGGDFRQATYRAVRQGLMQAQSVLLEPYYAFRLEVPFEQLGRAMNDIRLRKGSVGQPEESGGMSVLTGRAPVVLMNGYAAEVAAYTGGRGRLALEPAGYDVCHNTERVILDTIYQPEADMDNSPDSVFCAHGGGFVVKWDKVPEYMHLESCLKKKAAQSEVISHRRISIDDRELEAIMEREFGPVKYNLYRRPERVEMSMEHTELPPPRRQYVIVDGYNVIFAWDELKQIAQHSLESARDRLMNMLCSYSAYTGINVILVFDAYRVPAGQGERFDFHNIHIVYTKERELGDVYIEKLVAEIGKNEYVRVVTSDRMIQLTAIRSGVLRVSSAEFEREMDSVHRRIAQTLDNMEGAPAATLGDVIKKV